MDNFFSEEKIIEFADYCLTITPSIYDEERARWTTTKVEVSFSNRKSPMYWFEIFPGSDYVKNIISDDDNYIAIVCESQWYEDLYIFELPNLPPIASFEGVRYQDGASEGFFLGRNFFTLPTVSYEGGCGGLRRVSLEDGKVFELLPPELFLRSDSAPLSYELGEKLFLGIGSRRIAIPTEQLLYSTGILTLNIRSVL